VEVDRFLVLSVVAFVDDLRFFAGLLGEGEGERMIVSLESFFVEASSS